MFLMALTICLCPMQIQAANKDVTKKMKKDKNFCRIIKDITNYSCGMGTDGKVKEKLEGYNALSIAGYVGYQKGQSFFMKDEIQKISYDLFGIRPDTKSIPTTESGKARFVAQTENRGVDRILAEGKPFKYSGGDWGVNVPKNKIMKVIKVNKTTYKVTVKNRMKQWDRKMKPYTTGITKLRIKKNVQSSYRYIITKLVYKGNGKAYQ